MNNTVQNDAQQDDAAVFNQPPEQKVDKERRSVLKMISTGIVASSLVAPILIAIRSLFPNVLYEAPRRFKVGQLDKFVPGPTFLTDRRIFVFREENTLYCIGGICTHLGCTVQLVQLQSSSRDNDYEFQCPCHGSKFSADGTNYAGPAPRALDYYLLEVAADDGQLVVDLSQVVDKGRRLKI